MHIAVYCGSVSGNQEVYTEKAALFGRWMAEKGHVLIYGGAQGGLMGRMTASLSSAKRRSRRRSPLLCSKTVRQRSRASIPKRQAKPMMQRCFWQIREASTSITELRQIL